MLFFILKYHKHWRRWNLQNKAAFVSRDVPGHPVPVTRPGKSFLYTPHQIFSLGRRGFAPVEKKRLKQSSKSAFDWIFRWQILPVKEDMMTRRLKKFKNNQKSTSQSLMYVEKDRREMRFKFSGSRLQLLTVSWNDFFSLLGIFTVSWPKICVKNEEEDIF